MREEVDSAVIETDMVGEMTVLAVSDDVGSLGFAVLRKNGGEVGEGFEYRRDGFMIGEMGIWEEGKSGQLDEIRPASGSRTGVPFNGEPVPRIGLLGGFPEARRAATDCGGGEFSGMVSGRGEHFRRPVLFLFPRS
ncbi:hypothetical protein KSP39_PZI013241 [Platanthera zijinensis]|uniref:Uncharacterized protein n=1 Tax=Platanthera zijinensis TaxID=2320716 RepID=A0AAP0BCF4_9ASPA